MTDDKTGFVSSYLLYLLAAASEGASAEFHATVRDQGLRVPEWRVLAILVEQDGAMITRLAKFALMEQSRLTRIIDQMIDKGFVERAADKDDGRRVRIWLTAEGRRRAEVLVGEARGHEADVLASLPAAEAERLKPALQSLIAALEARG
ncbi:MAG: MarR family transcriptional regulator [Paracoccaceae bacterium]|jgi:DNA-binding MarR family transcriptional regulator|nr:MarR family transcriptional regulator [Paracoccaceae bacterium]MDG1373689.1 MarR family transcriptional regulator [Paracoccaceae bacterium]MDG1970791.1 MarR family transcriptional regulator [Paracoccaceae bacterium]